MAPHPAYARHAAMARPGRQLTLAVLALAVLAVTLALAGRLVTVDHLASVTGVTIGTDTRYCSAEDRWPVITCQAAR